MAVLDYLLILPALGAALLGIYKLGQLHAWRGYRAKIEDMRAALNRTYGAPDPRYDARWRDMLLTEEQRARYEMLCSSWWDMLHREEQARRIGVPCLVASLPLLLVYLLPL